MVHTRAYRLDHKIRGTFPLGFNRVDLPVSRIILDKMRVHLHRTAPTNTGTFPFDWENGPGCRGMVGATATSTVQWPRRACSVPTGLTARGRQRRKSRSLGLLPPERPDTTCTGRPAAAGLTPKSPRMLPARRTPMAGLPNARLILCHGCVNSCGASALSAYAGATIIPQLQPA